MKEYLLTSRLYECLSDMEQQDTTRASVASYIRRDKSRVLCIGEGKTNMLPRCQELQAEVTDSFLLSHHLAILCYTLANNVDNTTAGMTASVM